MLDQKQIELEKKKKLIYASTEITLSFTHKTILKAAYIMHLVYWSHAPTYDHEIC